MEVKEDEDLEVKEDEMLEGEILEEDYEAEEEEEAKQGSHFNQQNSSKGTDLNQQNCNKSPAIKSENISSDNTKSESNGKFSQVQFNDGNSCNIT